MNKFVTASAVALSLSSTSLYAAPIHARGDVADFSKVIDEPIWLSQANNGKGKGAGNYKKPQEAQGNTGKAKAGNGNAKASKGNERGNNGNADLGNGNGNGKNKLEKAGRQEPKANGNGVARTLNGKDNGANGRKAFTKAEREDAVSRLFSARAPDGRDMTRVLGSVGLSRATPQLAISETPLDELITYSNCPPGLANKNPPCVPPGLAKNGVAYDEWSSYNQERYDTIWIDRRDAWLGSGYEVDPNPDLLLLQSDEIAALFGIDPAPAKQHYGLIDGMPVLLDQDDYTSLLVINQLARLEDLADIVAIAPAAALTQDELISLYRLPPLGTDKNYAVLNGQLMQMNNSDYELLQMLRVARAVM